MEEVKETLLPNEKRDKLAESKGLVAKNSSQDRRGQNNIGDKKTHG